MGVQTEEVSSHCIKEEKDSLGEVVVEGMSIWLK